MIVTLKVSCIESPETGELLEWVLVDPEGRTVFRFGLVGPADRAAKDPMYGLMPEFFGLKMGDEVQLATDNEIRDRDYALAVSRTQTKVALNGRDRLLREQFEEVKQ